MKVLCSYGILKHFVQAQLLSKCIGGWWQCCYSSVTSSEDHWNTGNYSMYDLAPGKLYTNELYLN